MFKAIRNLFTTKKKSEKNFPINSLVKIDRKDITLDDFEDSCIYSELRKSDRFFYLGDVHDREGFCLVSSTKTGVVLDSPKCIFSLV